MLPSPSCASQATNSVHSPDLSVDRPNAPPLDFSQLHQPPSLLLMMNQYGNAIESKHKEIIDPVDVKAPQCLILSIIIAGVLPLLSRGLLTNSQPVLQEPNIGKKEELNSMSHRSLSVILLFRLLLFNPTEATHTTAQRFHRTTIPVQYTMQFSPA